MPDQPKPTIIKYPSQEEARIHFDAYTSAVGKVAYSWNFFHEKLCDLFIFFLSPSRSSVGRAVWYSTYSDRAQREMLRHAILALEEQFWEGFPTKAKARDDLIWLLQRANEIGDHRDNAIHAPALLSTDKDGSQMATSFFSQHRRARNLVGKDLLVEFDWCERYAENLSRFTILAARALQHNESWPDRPDAPNRRPKTAFRYRAPRQLHQE